LIITDLDDPQIEKAKASKQYDYSISLLERPDHTHYMVIDNWNTSDPADFRRLTWRIEKKANWKTRAKALLQRFSDFDERKKRFQEFLLLNALSADTDIGYSAGRYYDRKTALTLSFDAAYSRYRDESVRHRHYLQAGTEIVGATGVRSMQYFTSLVGPVKPWRSNINESKTRLSSNAESDLDEGLLSDDENYYSQVRSQGLDPSEATLLTVARSSAKEYAFEFRDEVSINDHINTTLGGFIVGRVLHEFGRLFSSGTDSQSTQLLRAAFGVPQRYNNWISKTKTDNRFDLDSTGFKPDVWGNANLFASSEAPRNPHLRQEAKTGSVGFDGQVIDIPLFESPGHAQRLITDTVFASAFLRKGLTSDSLENFKVFAKTTLAAYYEKDLGRDSEGNLTGHNLFIGPSMGLEIEDANNAFQQGKDDRTDFHGLVHVAGGTLDLTAYTHGYRIRCIIDVYGDLALMRSYAFERYQNSHDVSHAQDTLKDHDYYYGGGLTRAIGLVLNHDKFEGGVSVSDTRVGMIHHPILPSQTDEGGVHDRRETAEVWVAYQLTDSLKIRFGVEKNIRSGSVGDTNLTGSDIRKTATLIYTLK
jgi:hypothetical protein